MSRAPEQLAADIAARYEKTARAAGWLEAHDDDVTGAIVVYNEALGRHYTGADAWKLAALHEVTP